MKVAILSDIHGNAGALRATLDDVRKAGAQHLLILGDLVGYYYDMRGVLDQLRGWDCTVIGGNHEAMLDAARGNPAAALRYREKYGSGVDAALLDLSREEIDWLCGLPARMQVTLDSVVFELCHGSPGDRDRYVYPNADEEQIRDCEIAGSVVLIGHTHYPMVAVRPSCLLINSGSVGQARDFGGFASWALFDTQTAVVTLRRSQYDAAALEEEVRRRDPHLPYLREILRRGRLDAEGGST
jgi:predicted phosphodiesterase